MKYYYYINDQDKKEGPHDMITMMRRIRSGAVKKDTKIVTDEDEYVSASSIPELSEFFNRSVDDVRTELSGSDKMSFDRILSEGWHFVVENQNMTVFAGAVLLLSVLVGILVGSILENPTSGAMASWIVFALLQNFYFAVALRAYRGQRVDASFIEDILSPIASKLAFSSVIFSILILLGFFFFVVPGIILLIVYAYVPMFVMDYNNGIKETAMSVVNMLKKCGTDSLLKIGILTLCYAICVLFIIPIPVVMPIMAGSLCYIYEKISAM